MTDSIVATLQLLAKIEDWKVKSRKFVPFSLAREDDFLDAIVYDDEGIYHNEDCTSYAIIGDVCIDENHHDIISTYDDYFDGFYPRVIKNNKDGAAWIEVLVRDENVCFIIEDGRFYDVRL